MIKFSVAQIFCTPSDAAHSVAKYCTSCRVLLRQMKWLKDQVSGNDVGERCLASKNSRSVKCFRSIAVVVAEAMVARASGKMWGLNSFVKTADIITSCAVMKAL